MKQKLFLLFALGLLISAPALADAASPHVGVTGTSGFGDSTVTDFDTAGPPPFTLSLGVEVFYASGIYTYVYTITHDSLTKLDSFAVLNALYDVTTLNWGWVGGSDPFSIPVIVFADPISPITVLSFSNFTAGTLTVYLQSTLPPTSMATEFFFGAGGGGGTDPAQGLTLGPTDQGGGASFGVPEPSSILLLTFGLLSGGVIRFSIKRSRG